MKPQNIMNMALLALHQSAEACQKGKPCVSDGDAGQGREGEQSLLRRRLGLFIAETLLDCLFHVVDDTL